MDNFTPGLLKDAALVLTNPLTFIINLSLETGVVPSEWKVAKVSPLYKSESQAEIDKLQTNLNSPYFVEDPGENSLQTADGSFSASQSAF